MSERAHIPSLDCWCGPVRESYGAAMDDADDQPPAPTPAPCGECGAALLDAATAMAEALEMWPFKKRPSALCETCLERARAYRLATVWVYPNGHLLHSGGRLPTLDEWPSGSDVVTFCGLDVYGMGASRLHAMQRATVGGGG